MPFPPFREGELFLDVASYATNIWRLRNGSEATANDATKVSVPEAAVNRVVTPGGTAGADMSYTTWQGGRGWLVQPSDFTPTDTRGRALMKAQTVRLRAKWTASNSSATAAGGASLAQGLSIWRWNPTTDARTLIGSAQAAGANVSTVLGAETFLETSVSVPEVIFERGEVLFIQVGGVFDGTNDAVGTNTTTYSLRLGEHDDDTRIMFLTEGLRVHLTESIPVTGVGTATMPPRFVMKANAPTTGIGTADMPPRRVQKLVPVTGVSNVEALKLVRKTTFPVTGVGTIGRTLRVRKVAEVTGIGTVAWSRRIHKLVPVTGVGTVTVVRSWEVSRLMSVTGVGTIGRTLRVYKIPASVTGVGTTTMNRFWQAVRRFDVAGVGTIGRTLVVRKTIPVTGVGTTTLSRSWTVFRSFTTTGVGTITRTLRVRKTHPVTGVGTTMLARGWEVFRRFDVTGVGTIDRTLLARKSVPVTGVGTAQMSRAWIVIRSLDTTGVGTAEVNRAVIFVRSVPVTGVGTIRNRIELDWDDLPDTEGGGTPVIVKKPVFIFDD
jgi:hypothetical protein